MWLSKLLRGGVVILLSLATVELQASCVGPAVVPLVFWPGIEGPGSLFPLDWSSFLRGLPWGSFLSSTQFLLQDIGSWAVALVLWIHQPNIMPRQTHCLTKTGWICGYCRTCFWVKSSSPTLIYLCIRRKHVCILWGKENMMIIFWLESVIVSLIIYCLLTNSIPLKDNFACGIKCRMRSCGYILKCTTVFRGRCILKLLFASFSSVFTLIPLLWGDLEGFYASEMQLPILTST